MTLSSNAQFVGNKSITQQLIPLAAAAPPALAPPNPVNLSELYGGILIDTANLAIDRGIAVYGDLDISPNAAATHILPLFRRNRTGTSQTAAARFASTLHAADLYLAIACAAGNELAWKIFRSHFRKYIDNLCTWVHGPATGRKLAEAVFDDLALPDASGQCRIASYDGGIPLYDWLIEAAREAAELNVGTTIDSTASPDGDGQILFVALRHAAQEQLNEQERLMLLLRYSQNLRLGKIAALLGMHQSTVTRKMDRAMSRFRNHVIVLMHREGLTDDEANNYVSLLSSNAAFSFSIVHLIKSDPCPPACDLYRMRTPHAENARRW